ncbi:ATP-dependent helicase [Haloarcula sp. CGMCC 1.6347]|uniref:ATP-dependent helicase n=1 Tax=Haloarcula sp. CGMCC 1.6347 TaxID=3111455 RepID=UPI00300F6067
MNSVFETEFPWSENQKRVIEHRDGPLQVIACAGSGKTHTISARIAEMVSDGTPRDQILATTFTENAAEELKVRIRYWMEEAGLENQTLGDMFVDTIHAFCQEVLTEYGENEQTYDLLTDNEQRAFISEHFRRIGLDNNKPRVRDAKYKKIDWFKEDINILRREEIVDDVRESTDKKARNLIESYDNYQDLLEQYHFFDYQELIYRTVELLESDPEILEEVRDEYKYIIVDEYQDVNEIQEHLIQLLAGEDKNLCVVGDDDQSIYGWRGAKPENFLTFEKRYQAEKEVLAENYRSTELIVDLVEEFIGQNSNRISKPMESSTGFEVGDVYQNYFEQETEEIEFVLDRIEELIGTVYEDSEGEKQTLHPGDIGILFRRRADMEAYQDALQERDIPFTIRGQKNIFAHPISNFIRLAFGFIARGENPSFQVVDVEATSHVNDEIEWKQVSERELRQSIRDIDLIASSEEKIISFLKDRRNWYSDPSSRRIEPQEELQDLLVAMGVGTRISEDEDPDPFPESIMYNLGKVSELIKEFERVYEIIFPDQITELVEFLDQSYYFGDANVEDETLLDAVDLLTIHGAKGMEYPAVFVPSLTTKKFNNKPLIPRAYARPESLEWIPRDIFNYEAEYEATEEELRRLCYVALTRGEKFLHITGSEYNIGYSPRQSESPYYEELRKIDHPGVLYDPVPDPAPREQREIENSDKEYIYPTSFSELRYYQKCPYNFKLRDIYGFAPPIDQAFGYGFAIHDVLREIHERYEQDQFTLPISPGEIRELVQDPDRFHLRYAAGEIENNLRDSAQDILSTYTQEYQDDMLAAYRSEVPFEIVIGDNDSDGAAIVSGDIDLLEKRDPHTKEVEEIDIVDFKTSERPVGDEEPEKLRDARFQVQLYGLATREELDPNVTDGYVHYLDQDATESGSENPHRLPVDLDDTNLDRVGLLVDNHVEKIMDRDFHPEPSEKVCSECDFNDICAHSEAD